MDQKPKSIERSATNSLRTPHQKILRFSIAIAALVGVVIETIFGQNFVVSICVLVVGIPLVMVLARLFMVRTGVFAPKWPYVEDVAGRGDENILLDEFIRLGGSGARSAAARLKNDEGDREVVLPLSMAEAFERVEGFFTQNGVLVKDVVGVRNDAIKGLIGCGRAGMNPALVNAVLSGEDGCVKVVIHAIAKEGLIKQESGQEAARVLAEYLSRT
jgi:hypothetical protein